MLAGNLEVHVQVKEIVSDADDASNQYASKEIVQMGE